MDSNLIEIGDVLEPGSSIANLTNVSNQNDYKFDLFARYMLENIYVEKALTADGREITATDKESVVGILVLIIPKELELKLTNILKNCSSMTITKVLYEITPEDIFKDPTKTDDIGNLENIDPATGEKIDETHTSTPEPVVTEEPVPTPEVTDNTETGDETGDNDEEEMRITPYALTDEEVAALPTEGWIAIDNAEYMVTPREEGAHHYKKTSDGKITCEDCVDQNGRCFYCGAVTQ